METSESYTKEKTSEVMLVKEFERLKSGKDWEEKLDYCSVSKHAGKKSSAILLFLGTFCPFVQRTSRGTAAAVQSNLHTTICLPKSKQALRAISAPIIFGYWSETICRVSVSALLFFFASSRRKRSLFLMGIGLDPFCWSKLRELL